MIEAVFALAWFGWGQTDPPTAVSILLAAGSVVALLVTAASGATTYRLRADPSPLARPEAARRYGIVVAVEFAVAGAGAATFSGTGRADLIAAWVCLAVGAHFLPLGKLFPDIGMTKLAVAMAWVGATGFAVAGTDVLPATVTGLGAGTCLLGHAASMLIAARHRPVDAEGDAPRQLVDAEVRAPDPPVDAEGDAPRRPADVTYAEPAP